MSESGVAFGRLIGNLLADFRDPSFIWQLAALLVSLALAGGFARYWQSTHAPVAAGRLRQVGSRLAFPLAGMVRITSYNVCYTKLLRPV